jgi:hypothetical protein
MMTDNDDDDDVVDDGLHSDDNDDYVVIDDGDGVDIDYDNNLSVAESSHCVAEHLSNNVTT